MAEFDIDGHLFDQYFFHENVLESLRDEAIEKNMFNAAEFIAKSLSAHRELLPILSGR